jgi:hypothetical protein
MDMGKIMKDVIKGKGDEVDPKSLTEMRVSYRDNKDISNLMVDVELEKMIIREIRKRIDEGSQEDFCLIILENLMMVYDDPELSILYEMFKLGEKPIQKGNAWCFEHLKEDS